MAIREWSIHLYINPVASISKPPAGRPRQRRLYEGELERLVQGCRKSQVWWLSIVIQGELAEWLGDKKMGHVRGAPYHPQTQGKIERWHQTLKNRILLENYFFPVDLEAQIEAFVDHDNHQRYHESINNLTPADVYFGRGKAILKQRERIKRKTMEARRLQFRKHAA